VTDDLEDVERWLRGARPAPRAEFVRAVEASLLPAARPPRRAGRPLLAAVGSAAALVVLLVLMGIAGLLPAGLGDQRSATADERCRTVLVQRSEVRRRVVAGKDGQLRVVSRRELVTRPVRRCR
jgi:hypothetical protein